MWWNKKTPARKTRREELMAARDTLRRQIELLGIDPVYNAGGNPDRSGLIAELSTTLGRIDKELAEEMPATGPDPGGP